MKLLYSLSDQWLMRPAMGESHLLMHNLAVVPHYNLQVVPAIVLLKTFVLLTISSRRQEKTVSITSSYFKSHYYELSSRSRIMDHFCEGKHKATGFGH